MTDIPKNQEQNNICEKNETGKHGWEVKLHSPGHHGDKRMVEVFVCKFCGMKKPIKNA